MASGATQPHGAAGLPGYTFEVPEGDTVFREGDLGTEMFLVQEGTVEIFTGSGGQESILATCEKGDFFGEMAVLEGLPRSATARAATHARLLRINGSTLAQMIQANPDIAVRMMKKLSRRLRETDDMLRQALSGDEPSGSSLTLPGGSVSLPAAAVVRAGDLRLIHKDTGREFRLSGGSETSIGRRDPMTGIQPDIDLTPVDEQRSISRRHAKISRRGGKLFLVEERATLNGTFRNGERLETGVPVEIRPGDEVRCGVVDLELTAG